MGYFALASNEKMEAFEALSIFRSKDVVEKAFGNIKERLNCRRLLVSEGFLARCMQHEFDHLDGKMFIDRISPLRKQLIKNKLKALLQGRFRCGYKTKLLPRK